VARLAAFHRHEPVAAGLSIAALRRDIAAPLSLPAFTAFLHQLGGLQRVMISGGIASAPGHDVSANPTDRGLWERIHPALLEAGAIAPTVAELATDVGCDERALRDMLFRRRGSRGVWRVGNDRFYLPAIFAKLAASAAALAGDAGDGSFTAAEFRDAIGTGRTLAIQILEALDAAGITVRVGDRRRTRQDFVPILGAAEPLRPQRATAAAASPISSRRTPPQTGKGAIASRQPLTKRNSSL